MTDKLALWLAGLILVALALDWALTGFQATLFVARKFADLIEWVAFWR